MSTARWLPLRSGESADKEPGKPGVRVFVSFDLEHDAQLYDLLLAQSRATGSGFQLCGCSEHLTDSGLWSSQVRRQIREADQVIVICGEHTEDSPLAAAELRIAREERIPYLLLWGRREFMCTKPVGAGPAEGIYSWTDEVLQERLDYIRRTAASAEMTPDPQGDR